MRQKLRDNGLSIVVFCLFLLFWAGQSFAGWRDHNLEQLRQNKATQTLSEYLSSSEFWSVTFENWESEFLQMAAYVLFTVWLFQRGSAESKDPDKKEPADEEPEDHQ